MARSWDNVKPATRSQRSHPLLSFGADLVKISAANKAALEAAGKGNTISLAVGDPALDGNLPPPQLFMDQMEANIRSTTNNGYTPCIGLPSTRQAVADYWVRWFAPSQAGRLSGNDVILASGCSDSLSIIFGALANRGEHILLPEPFFAQYDMCACHYGIEPIYYRCDPAKNWEVDLPALRAIIEADTEKKIKGILINNPSNPCGSNWSRAHVEALVKLLDELNVPIISDEIYCGMAYNIYNPAEEVPTTSVADIDSNAVRFIVGGASKRFAVPGERMGWIIHVDPTGAGKEVMNGVRRLAARFFVPMTAVQRTLEVCLKEVDESYYCKAKAVLCENSAYLYDALKKTGVMEPGVPCAGMFLSVLLKTDQLEPGVRSGVDFANKLAAEENVHVFPGEPFRMPNAIRLTLSRPKEVVEESVRRLQHFCDNHRVKA